MDVVQLRRAFSEHHWTQWFALHVLGQGCVYAAAGRVEPPDCIPVSDNESEWEIQSVVQGAKENLYGCCVQVAMVSGSVRVMGECDCPVRRNCKHAAAVLFMFACYPDLT